MLDTRLRFVRRLIYATILLIGIAVALSQFTGLSKLAASVLASGALAAAIIGFAARQTLANVVAGIMLAITQPLRVGDWVTFEEHYGVVEDVRLNYTVLRTSSDQRVVIPNERLAAGILRNDTLGSDAIGLDVSVWLPLDADTERALAALARRDRQRGARSPRSRPRACASRSAATRCRRRRRVRGRPSCARSASGACASEGLLGRETAPRRRIRQGYTRWFARFMERALEA